MSNSPSTDNQPPQVTHNQVHEAGPQQDEHQNSRSSDIRHFSNRFQFAWQNIAESKIDFSETTSISLTLSPKTLDVEIDQIDPAYKTITAVHSVVDCKQGDEESFDESASELSAAIEVLPIFYSKLETVDFCFRQNDEQQTIAKVSRSFDKGGSTVCIHKTTGADFVVESKLRYHVVRVAIKNLPNDPSRPNINHCTGVLAFPIDESGFPREHVGYDVYNSFPVSTVGFKFLLDADFLLQENNQDLIDDSVWNEAIIEQLSIAFCDAITSFCSNPSLRFYWMNYLPIGKAFNAHPLWKRFSTNVLRELRQRPILFLHDEGEEYLIPSLRKPSELRILPDSCRDEFGLPMFPDLSGPHRRYLSSEYDELALDDLKVAFDLQEISDQLLYDRIEADMESSFHGTVTKKSLEWQSRAADLIIEILERSPSIGTKIKRRLTIIPLSRGTWVTASTGDLHFPSSKGPALPEDLVDTVHRKATKCKSTTKMLLALGVTRIDPASVVDRIWEAYSSGGEPGLKESQAHLKYLYWHHPNTKDSRVENLYVYDDHMETIHSKRGLIYMPSDGVFGPLNVLKAASSPGDDTESKFDCVVPFLRLSYMFLFSNVAKRHGLSWMEWLEKALNIRQVIRLKDDSGVLSPEFRYIIACQPEKFVRLLKLHWQSYSSQVDTGLENEISQTIVKCRNNTLAALSTTYCPGKELVKAAREISMPPDFPFLQIVGITDSYRYIETRGWIFLERFGVKFEADIEFYLDVLRTHSTHTFHSLSQDIIAGIVRIYDHITDLTTDQQKSRIKNIFEKENLLLHPRVSEIEPQEEMWLKSSDIESFSSKAYRSPSTHPNVYPESEKMDRFFNEIIGVERAKWRSYLRILRNLRRQVDEPVCLNQVIGLYTSMFENEINEIEKEYLQEEFEQEQLIYIPTLPFWISPSQCFWNSPVSVLEKTVLEGTYPHDLKAFFENYLEVFPIDLGTLVQRVSSFVEGDLAVPQAKEIIFAINERNPIISDLKPLATCPILPVRRKVEGIPEIVLGNSERNFAVVDRTILADIFDEHLAFVDFSMEEVAQLAPFLSALELGDRYLSRNCVEETCRCIEETSYNDVSVYSESLTEEFQKRAYHLLRCAVFNQTIFKSDGLNSPAALYHRLSTSSIALTYGISTQYSFKYPNGEEVQQKVPGTGHVHIHDEGDHWTIFVPQDPLAREVAYQKKLPYALAELLGATPDTAEKIGYVLNSSSLGVIEYLLQTSGIGHVPGVPKPEVVNCFNIIEEHSDDFDNDSEGSSWSEDHDNISLSCSSAVSSSEEEDSEEESEEDDSEEEESEVEVSSEGTPEDTPGEDSEEILYSSPSPPLVAPLSSDDSRPHTPALSSRSISDEDEIETPHRLQVRRRDKNSRSISPSIRR